MHKCSLAKALIERYSGIAAIEMFVEVDRSQFPLVSPLLEASTYLSLCAIIRCESSGRMWLDNESDVGSAIAWDLTNGFLFVLGKSNSKVDLLEMNHFLKEELVPEAREKGYAELNTILLLDSTEAQRSRLFQGLSTSTRNLCHFHLEGTKAIRVPTVDVTNGFWLKRIGRNLLDNSKLANIDEVRRCIIACWQDLSRYLLNGVGFVVIDDNAAVSWCSTDYVISGKCDLYVETFEAYRRKGFGTIVASACVKECLSRKLEVNWHCWCQNLESTGLARKIGLLQKPNQKVHVISLQ